MKNRSIILFLLLIFLAYNSFAQEDKVVIRFLDVVNDSPLSNVTIIVKSGTAITYSDREGYATLSFSMFNYHKYLLAIADGYKPDTLRSPETVVYLSPLSVMLNAEVVNCKFRSMLTHHSVLC